MAGPERRESVKWWVITAVVLAVLVSGAGLGVRHLLASGHASTPVSATSPPLAPTSSPSSLVPPSGSATADPDDPVVVKAADGALLPGSGGGELFVQSATAIYRIELATGQVTRTRTPPLEQFSNFVAGPGWVVFKTVDNDSGVVVRNGEPARELPLGLRPNGRLYPAPDGDLWRMPEEPSRGVRVVTRVDIDGRPVRAETIRVADEFGILSADGDRYLLAKNSGGVYQFRPSGPRRLTSGDLIAVGPRHLLVWDCDKLSRCNAYRLDRRTHKRTLFAGLHQRVLGVYQGDPTQASAYNGEMSPDGTKAAVGGQSGTGSWPVTVLNLGTGRSDTLPGSLTEVNGNTQLTWTTNSRWLLAITDHQLRAYDTKTGMTRTIPITSEPLLHLVSRESSGN